MSSLATQCEFLCANILDRAPKEARSGVQIIFEKMRDECRRVDKMVAEARVSVGEAAVEAERIEVLAAAMQRAGVTMYTDGKVTIARPA